MSAKRNIKLRILKHCVQNNFSLGEIKKILEGIGLYSYVFPKQRVLNSFFLDALLDKVRIEPSTFNLFLAWKVADAISSILSDEEQEELYMLLME